MDHREAGGLLGVVEAVGLVRSAGDTELLDCLSAEDALSPHRTRQLRLRPWNGHGRAAEGGAATRGIPCRLAPSRVGVADGLTDKRSAKAREILPAGALLWAWDADADYDEPAGEKLAHSHSCYFLPSGTGMCNTLGAMTHVSWVSLRMSLNVRGRRHAHQESSQMSQMRSICPQMMSA